MPQGVNMHDAAVSIDFGDLGQSQISACIRQQFASPEEISSGSQTAPSKRIGNLCRGYPKMRHGTLGASRIGLPSIRVECPLFAAWMSQLKAIAFSNRKLLDSLTDCHLRRNVQGDSISCLAAKFTAWFFAWSLWTKMGFSPHNLATDRPLQTPVSKQFNS